MVHLVGKFATAFVAAAAIELKLTFRPGSESEQNLSAQSVAKTLGKAAGWEKSPKVTITTKDDEMSVLIIPDKGEKLDTKAPNLQLRNVEVKYRLQSPGEGDPGDYTIVLYATCKDEQPAAADIKSIEPTLRAIGALAARKTPENTRIKLKENKRGVLEYSAW